MKAVRKRTAFLTAILLLAACNPARGQTSTGPSVQDLAATIAAATINAGGTATATAGVASATAVVTPTTQPVLFISVDHASCRSGPGPDFEVIASYPAGASVDMLGKDSADSYWIVLDPASNKLCWIQAQDATPSGSFDTLPEMTPQPVRVTVPNKPSRGAWNFYCDNTTLTTILGWNAPSGPVNGYRIYREGNQIADVPATQTSYTETVPFTYGSSIMYAVAAYNDAGTSQQTVWNFHCP
jgi:hypothetical protein